MFVNILGKTIYQSGFAFASGLAWCRRTVYFDCLDQAILTMPYVIPSGIWLCAHVPDRAEPFIEDLCSAPIRSLDDLNIWSHRREDSRTLSGGVFGAPYCIYSSAFRVANSSELY